MHRCNLVGMIRCKDGMPFVRYTLNQMQKMCDHIVFLDDNSKDGSGELAQTYSKVHYIKSPFDTYNEARDRNFIMMEAKKFDPRWIVTLDADEMFEEPKIYKMLPELLNPIDPQVNQYIFPLLHHWDSPNLWRSDGLWKVFTQSRMFRNLPNQTIESLDSGSSLSGSCPFISSFNTKHVFCRIRHYGNMLEETRKRKYEFYKNVYETKGVSPLALGGWEPYYKRLYKKDILEPADYARHIVGTEGQRLSKWVDNLTIAANITTKNECQGTIGAIKSISRIVDEIVVLDTGSTDKTVETMKELGCKVIQDPWRDDFSYSRNICLKNTVSKKIIRIDSDEVAEDPMAIWYLANMGEITGFVFPIKNYTQDPKIYNNAEWFHSQTIRLFNNEPYIKYKGLVHEDIEESISKNGGNIMFGDTHLLHYGYLKDEKYKENKFKYYYDLCKKQTELNPNSFYHFHSMGVHKKHIGEYKEAKELFLKAYAIQPMSFLSLIGLGELAEKENKTKEALEYFTQADKIQNPLKGYETVKFLKAKIINLKIQIETGGK